jgi:hypothetical protein
MLESDKNCHFYNKRQEEIKNRKMKEECEKRKGESRKVKEERGWGMREKNRE